MEMLNGMPLTYSPPPVHHFAVSFSLPMMLEYFGDFIVLLPVIALCGSF